ncbi:hypothetical protein G9A89_023988 [Geosiphon pyriformis]|nr:hypothetical protein G9A89_023988 [Geosiphon pyriformis]
MERNFLPWELGWHQMKTTEHTHIITVSHAIKNDMGTQNIKKSVTTNHVSLAVNSCSIKKYGMTFLGKKKCAMLHANTQSSLVTGYPHNENEIWHMANAKIEGAMPSEILEIKNYSPEPVDIVLIPNPDAFLNIETGPEKFYKHYQNLAPTREKQKQHLEEINT